MAGESLESDVTETKGKASFKKEVWSMFSTTENSTINVSEGRYVKCDK